MLKNQKYQQNREKSAFGFRTFEDANVVRNKTRDALAKAKDKTAKVKVRLRPSGLFDVLVFQPVPAKAEAEAKSEK